MVSQFRFCIGDKGFRSSRAWKLCIQGDEIYLLAKRKEVIEKFSFHKSGSCRWAINSDKWIAKDTDRAMTKWQRDLIPEAGTGKAAMLMQLAFPTNHLSTTRLPSQNNIYWLAPAGDGKALGITLSLTGEPSTRAEQLLSESTNEHLIFQTHTRSGVSLVVTAGEFSCGVVELTVPETPKAPGQVFGNLRFPNNDDTSSGRPVRMCLLLSKKTSPTAWELGGYRVSDDY